MILQAELAVSNICWPDGAVANGLAMAALQQEGVRYIDIAPTKAFPNIEQEGITGVTPDDVNDFRRSIGRYGMSVSGFQALTYNRSENFITGTTAERTDLQRYMKDVIHLGELVGAQTLVYGSGGTRTYEGLTDEQVTERAAEFFSGLDDAATDSGVVLGIESVSTTWTKGMNVFGRSGADTVRFVDWLQAEHGTQSIKFVPDTFAMHDYEPKKVRSTFLAAKDRGVLAPHMQIAEPGMAVHTPESPIDHQVFDEALYYSLAGLARAYPGKTPIIAIEMFKPEQVNGPADIQKPLIAAVTAAQADYEWSLGRKLSVS